MTRAVAASGVMAHNGSRNCVTCIFMNGVPKMQYARRTYFFYPQKISEKCFKKCITSPSSALDSREQVRPCG